MAQNGIEPKLLETGEIFAAVEVRRGVSPTHAPKTEDAEDLKLLPVLHTAQPDEIGNEVRS